jgi:hypothetical protein
LELAAAHRVAAERVGTTGGNRLEVQDMLNLSLRALREAWEGTS